MPVVESIDFLFQSPISASVPQEKDLRKIFDMDPSISLMQRGVCVLGIGNTVHPLMHKVQANLNCYIYRSGKSIPILIPEGMKVWQKRNFPEAVAGLFI